MDRELHSIEVSQGKTSFTTLSLSQSLIEIVIFNFAFDVYLLFSTLGIDGLVDMKHIYGITVARKKVKQEKEDKVSKKNTQVLFITIFNC